jgi:hypothetical protein
MGRRSSRWVRAKVVVRRLAKILGAAFLVVGSIGMALEGNPIGYVGVLLFLCAPLVPGAGAVMDARRSAPHARGPTFERGTLAGAGRHVDDPVGLVFSARRGPLLLVIAGGGIFVLIGVILLVMAVQDGSGGGLFTGVLGVISAGFFGPFVLYAVLGLVGPRGGVLLLPEGVFCRFHAGTAWLPWRTFQVRAERRAGQALVAFALLDTAAPRPVLTGPNRWLRPIQRAFGADLYVVEMVLPLRAYELEALLHALDRNPTTWGRIRHATTVDELFEPPSPT